MKDKLTSKQAELMELRSTIEKDLERTIQVHNQLRNNLGIIDSQLALLEDLLKEEGVDDLIPDAPEAEAPVVNMVNEATDSPQ